MYNHAPANYVCPICELVQGRDSRYNKKSDIVYQDEQTIAFISPKWWPNNPGHVIIVPKAHYENIYDIPDAILGAVNVTAKKLALALKTVYQCEGISTRQHNEPAGNQDLWHFHLHVYPRYNSDDLYIKHNDARYVESDERLPYAIKLKEYFAK